MTRHVYVAIPNHSGAVRGETTDSLLTAQAECYAKGWKFTTQRLTGGYHHVARNRFLAMFNAEADVKGYTDLVWWDDDVAATPGQFVPFVEHDVDFVCAPYRHKRDIESYPGEWPDVGERKMRESASTKTPLFNAKYWVIGLSRQTRSCIKRILAQPDLKWINDDVDPDLRIPYVFRDEFLGGGDRPWTLFVEDYPYCRQWIDLGGDVWVDPMMQTGHSGSQAWWGCMATQMEAAVRQHRIDEALAKVAE